MDNFNLPKLTIIIILCEWRDVVTLHVETLLMRSTLYMPWSIDGLLSEISEEQDETDREGDFTHISLPWFIGLKQKDFDYLI